MASPLNSTEALNQQAACVGGGERKWAFKIQQPCWEIVGLVLSRWNVGWFVQRSPLPWEVTSCSHWALGPPTARQLPGVPGFSLPCPSELASQALCPCCVWGSSSKRDKNPSGAQNQKSFPEVPALLTIGLFFICHQNSSQRSEEKELSKSRIASLVQPRD